jgi:hypothetical protein
MEGPKGFAEIWSEANRERGEFVWSIISRLMATPRRSAPPRPAQGDAPYRAAPAMVARH